MASSVKTSTSAPTLLAMLTLAAAILEAATSAPATRASLATVLLATTSTSVRTVKTTVTPMPRATTRQAALNAAAMLDTTEMESAAMT